MIDDRIETEAADWHVLTDSDAMDWDAFAVWLDSSPVHRLAYDRVAMLDADVRANAPAIAARLPANDKIAAPVRRQGRWYAGGLVAAALAVAVLPNLMGGGETLVAYQTGPSETRLVTLHDGSSIRLDRNTRLSVGDGASRKVELATGAAYFDVKHDPARPFTVLAGGYQVRDVGTRFDVARRDAGLSVAVADGQVAVSRAGGEATPLTAGHRIDIASATSPAEMRAIDPANVAAWRDGRLVYEDTPLPLVAADAARYAGHALTVDPKVASLRFSGVLTIGDGSHLVDQIQAVLPVQVRRKGDDWRLVPGRAR